MRLNRLYQILMKTTKRFSRGFTLIELMIVLLIGTLMTIGLIQLFTITRQSYLTSVGVGTILENTNAAVTNLRSVIGFARHQGVVGIAGAPKLFEGCWTDNTAPSLYLTKIGTGVTLNQCVSAASTPCPPPLFPVLNNPPPCNGTLSVPPNMAMSFAMRNYNGSTGECWIGSNGDPRRNGPVACSATSTVDYLYLIQGVATGSWDLTKSQPGYIPYFSANFGASNGSDVLNVAYQGERDVSTSKIFDCFGNPVDQFTLVINTYKIMKDAQNNPYLACFVTSLNTLNSSLTWNTSGSWGKIASGVEGFRVILGVDTDLRPDGGPNQYVSPSSFAQGIYWTQNIGSNVVANFTQNTERIVSVQIALLMRTDNQTVLKKDTKKYTLLNNDHGPFNDMRMRKIYNLTLKSNECLPTIRSDCKGAEFYISGVVSGAGYLKPDPTGATTQMVWFSKQPYLGVTYGCGMDPSGNIVAQQISGSTTTVGNPVPFLYPWGRSSSPDNNVICGFR